MHALALVVGDLQNTLPPLTRIEELEHRRVQLKQSIQHCLDRLAKMKTAFPLSLEQEIEDESWVQARCAEIQQQSELLIAQRTVCIERLAHLEASVDVEPDSN